MRLFVFVHGDEARAAVEAALAEPPELANS
jgi:hypothetical protein